MESRTQSDASVPKLSLGSWAFSFGPFASAPWSFDRLCAYAASAAKAALAMASAATAVPAMTAIARRPVRERWYFMTVVLWCFGILAVCESSRRLRLR